MNSSIENILVYSRGRQSQQKVKKFYLEWRKTQNPPIPFRCDIPGCLFYESPLIWNGKNINLILDHKNGVSGDNRPKNLRLLCPNCNSQQPTYGGHNKGRTEQYDGGFSIKNPDGKRNYVLPAGTGNFLCNFGSATLTYSKIDRPLSDQGNNETD